MRDEIIGKVAVDLLSIPHLIFRIVRRKLVMTSLSDVDKDIKFPHIEIMAVLKEEGTLNIKDICDRLQVAKAQMTYLIDKLVDYKLVDRNTDPSDRRIFNISLTEHGRIFYDKREKEINTAVQDYMSVLSDREVETLSDSLNNLRDTLLKLQ